MSDETTPAPAPEEKPEEKPAEAPAAEDKPAETPAPAPEPQLSDVTPTPEPQPAPVSVAAPHDTAGHGDGHGDDHHHALPFNPWIIFFALLILTGISWAADAFLGGRFSILTISVIVMMVSLCKATLVVAFFMHYRYETKWKYVLTLPPMIVGVLIMLALVPDVGYRHSGTQRPVDAKAAADAKRAPWNDPATGAGAAKDAAPKHDAPKHDGAKDGGEHGAKKAGH